MGLLRLKIDVLKSFLYKEIKRNGYNFNEYILSLSQILDEYIVTYERERQENI
jgi:hypothetical protein